MVRRWLKGIVTNFACLCIRSGIPSLDLRLFNVVLIVVSYLALRRFVFASHEWMIHVT